MRSPRMILAGAITLLQVALCPELDAESPVLTIRPGSTPQAITLAGEGAAQRSHRVEMSPELSDWGPVFAIRDNARWSWEWDDVGESAEAFFRLVEAIPPVIAAHASWKNQLRLPGDDFLSEPVAGTGVFGAEVDLRWVKFALILDALPEVHFQKSAD